MGQRHLREETHNFQRRGQCKRSWSDLDIESTQRVFFITAAAALEVKTDELLDDSVPASAVSSADEIVSVLERCTAQEAKVLVDVIKATKLSMDKYL